MLAVAAIGNMYCRKDSVSSHTLLCYVLETQQIIIITIIINMKQTFISVSWINKQINTFNYL